MLFWCYWRRKELFELHESLPLSLFSKSWPVSARVSLVESKFCFYLKSVGGLPKTNTKIVLPQKFFLVFYISYTQKVFPWTSGAVEFIAYRNPTISHNSSILDFLFQWNFEQFKQLWFDWQSVTRFIAPPHLNFNGIYATSYKAWQHITGL